MGCLFFVSLLFEIHTYIVSSDNSVIMTSKHSLLSEHLVTDILQPSGQREAADMHSEPAVAIADVPLTRSIKYEYQS